MINLDRPDRAQLRRELPLAFVASQLNVIVSPDTGRALCPLHDDTSPSFRLWEADDGETLWWCDPCGVGGDIFELIMRVRGVSFPEALEEAHRMQALLPADYAPPPLPVQQARQGPDDWALDVAAARQRADANPGSLSVRSGLVPDTDQARSRVWDQYLRTVWGWGLGQDGGVWMPHWNGDARLTGCKVRYPSGNRSSLEGSKYDALYGSWLGRRHPDLLLCEGETDTAYAAYTAHQEGVLVDVFGLPSGVQRPPGGEIAQFIGQRKGTVYLALDPDPAGVAGTKTWIKFLSNHNIEMRLCLLPQGLDVRAAHASVRALMQAARRPLFTPDDPVARPGGYVRLTAKGGERTVCTWTLEPTAQLVGGTEPGYEVILHTQGTKTATTIKLKDLSNVGALRRWANTNNEIFPGNDNDVQAIATQLDAQAAVTPEVFQTDQVGLHEPKEGYEFAGHSVVYTDDKKTGILPWKYVPSSHTADVTGRLRLPTQAEADWNVLELFLELSHTSVMHPILAWLVAAARRPAVQDFPLLFIGGSSGVGKSTLARLALQLAGSGIEIDLGAVTAHVLLRTLASSRSLPVFVDEWTRQSRRDTREAFQQAIPNLYTSGAAERGQADLTVVTYHMSSPVLVAGEDTFTLDRENQRTIRVGPTRAWQNHLALRRLRGLPLEALGQRLHQFLTRTDVELPEFSQYSQDRPAHNKHVLEVGWATLHTWLDHEQLYGQQNIPDLPLVPDLSCLEVEATAEAENVYELALVEGLAMKDSSGLGVVWSDEDGTWFRSQVLVNLIARNTDIELPGRSRAMCDYFAERFGQLDVGRASPPGSLRAVRAHLIPGLHLDDSSSLEDLIRKEET